MEHWVRLSLNFMGVGWASQNRGDVLVPHHSAFSSLLRQFNAEAVLDVIVAGNGDHVANYNVNAGLRLHISFCVKHRVFGRCCAQDSEAKRSSRGVIEGQQLPGSTPLVRPKYSSFWSWGAPRRMQAPGGGTSEG